MTYEEASKIVIRCLNRTKAGVITCKGPEMMREELVIAAAKFILACEAKGMPLVLVYTYRSKKEQDALYAQGRTAPGAKVTNAKYGQSPHNTEEKGNPAASAFDVMFVVNGVKTYNTPNYDKAGPLAQQCGLYWGGNFKDKPHYELPDWKAFKPV